MGLKLDMSKAYDRVKWGFLESLLKVMGFPSRWNSLIMKCVSTVSFSVLVNGIPHREFCPQRGLRQGDLLSPYLFILCVEAISAMLSSAVHNGLIHGIKVSPSAPMISHLFFCR